MVFLPGSLVAIIASRSEKHGRGVAAPWPFLTVSRASTPYNRALVVIKFTIVSLRCNLTRTTYDITSGSELCNTMGRINLNKTDKKIISKLEEGRNVPANIAEELDLSRQYVQQRLRRLEEHGHVQNIGRGVYEMIDDPRDRPND